jgi:hypothetical protein
MIFELHSVSDETLKRLHADPESVIGLIEEGSSDDRVDLDKAWHAIHFLLAGSADGGAMPAGFLLSGGTEIGDVDVGYGPARGLTPQQTAEVASMLKELPTEALLARYDAAALEAADIYPSIWGRDGDEAREYVEEYYGVLRQFVEGAAARKQGLVLLVA